MGAGIQCLEACEDLHKYGFIHRDLKPANYACGLGDKKRVIYILDFGIARKILNVKGELKTPRQSVRFKVGQFPLDATCVRLSEALIYLWEIFYGDRSTRHEILNEKNARPSRGRKRMRLSCDCDATGPYSSSYSRTRGTIRFASLSCHKNAEMGPKDDCESWYYLLLDIAVPKGIIWRSINDKNEVLKVKEQLRKEKRETALGAMKCKEELGKVLDYIDSLKYHDRVDYDFIYKMLTQAAKTEGGDINDPYDWEKSEKPAMTAPTCKSTANSH
ncbi:hypothetical protein Y032_0103g3525 [Ancylostoma ceylanicum]|nr:hypothetical protein Y032_0103g3525 [Ancylostoma ceylanicum]